MGLGLVSCLHYSYTSNSRQIAETNQCFVSLDETRQMTYLFTLSSAATWKRVVILPLIMSDLPIMLDG